MYKTTTLATALALALTVHAQAHAQNPSGHAVAATGTGAGQQAVPAGTGAINGRRQAVQLGRLPVQQVRRRSLGLPGIGLEVLARHGHRHAYLRTFPMKGDRVVDSPADGPVYIHAVSGTKMYRQSDAPYIAKRFTDIATYQVIDIDGGRLQYTAYDVQGRVMDAFTIDK